MVKKYTVAEYAHKKKVSRMTVYTWIKKKKLPLGTVAKVYCCGLCIEVVESPEIVAEQVLKVIREAGG